MWSRAEERRRGRARDDRVEINVQHSAAQLGLGERSAGVPLQCGAVLEATAPPPATYVSLRVSLSSPKPCPSKYRREEPCKCGRLSQRKAGVNNTCVVVWRKAVPFRFRAYGT